MTVPAKPSSNGTRWVPAAVSLAVTALCAPLVAGCSSSGTATALAAAPPSSAPPAQPTACSPWAGLDDLANVTTWLRQMIGDEVIFGASTQQAKRDGLAVVVYARSLGVLSANLPGQYSRELRQSVLPVAASPYKETPEQLNTAANAAESLGSRISQVCLLARAAGQTAAARPRPARAAGGGAPR